MTKPSLGPVIIDEISLLKFGWAFFGTAAQPISLLTFYRLGRRHYDSAAT